MFYLVGEGQQSVEVRRQLRGVVLPQRQVWWQMP